MYARIEDFLEELAGITARHLPQARCETVYVRLDKASLRWCSGADLFVDIYANIDSGSFDFSLIRRAL